MNILNVLKQYPNYTPEMDKTYKTLINAFKKTAIVGNYGMIINMLNLMGDDINEKLETFVVVHGMAHAVGGHLYFISAIDNRQILVF